MARVLDRETEQVRSYDIREVVPAGDLAPVPSRRERLVAELQRPVSTRTAAVIGVSWLLWPLAGALEPAPAHPDAPPPVLIVVAQLVMLGAMVGALAGLGQRRRWGVASSLAAATILVGFSVACPLSGHHTFGAWWFGQMACVLAVFGVNMRAFNRT